MFDQMHGLLLGTKELDDTVYARMYVCMYVCMSDMTDGMKKGSANACR